MDKPLLCINTGLAIYDVSDLDKMEVIKAAGFDGIFNDKGKHSDYKETEAVAEKAAKLGLIYQSLHAPFYGMDDLWHDDGGEIAKIMEQDLINSIDDCHNFDIPLVIMHAIIGMDNVTPNELGLERIGKIIDYAVKKNVTIGFENTEGEMYLGALFDRFGEIENVGFTFDSGHEMCYNRSQDMLGRFGKYLVSTHLNDNFGISDPNKLDFLDDAHVLPFDGKADWQGIADRLHKCNYDGMLTFELNKNSRPSMHTNDMYLNMTTEEYVAEAYNRAVKFREMYMK